MFKYTVSLLALFVLLVAACVQPVRYVGRSYPPTFHVDLYFSEEDITKDYQVMGRAVAEASEGSFNVEELQEELEAKAREKGADGIVIYGFDRIQTSAITRTDEKTDDAVTVAGVEIVPEKKSRPPPKPPKRQTRLKRRLSNINKIYKAEWGCAASLNL